MKIGTKQPVIMACLIIALLLFPGCSSKFFRESGAGGNDFKAMISQFWANVRPVKDLAVAHYKLARFYQQKGQHQKAIIELKKAIHSYPKYITAYNALGISFDAVSDYENAELAYRKAISLNPKLAYLYNNLGYSYLCRGDHDSAIMFFEKAAHLDGQTRTIYNNLQLARTKSIENNQFQQQASIINFTKEQVDESLKTQIIEAENIVNDQTLDLNSEPSTRAMSVSGDREIIGPELIKIAADLDTQVADIESIVNHRSDVQEDKVLDIERPIPLAMEVPEKASLQRVGANRPVSIFKENSATYSLSIAQKSQTTETNPGFSDLEKNRQSLQKSLIRRRKKFLHL